MIMLMKMRPPASGWRAIDSTALPPMMPTPNAGADDDQTAGDGGAEDRQRHSLPPSRRGQN